MLGWYDAKGYAQGRQDAKAANHAAAYGMGSATMARNYNLPERECKVALEKWHARHPGVRAHLHREVEQAIKLCGEVVLFNGSVRRFHAAKLLWDSGNLNRWDWEAILREGVNCKAQGGTAVIMKQAMLDIYDHLRDTPRLRGIRPITERVMCGVNQVHDELLFECPN